MIELKEELVEFLQEIHPVLLKSSPPTTTEGHCSSYTPTPPDVVDALIEAVDWTEAVTHEGRAYEVC